MTVLGNGQVQITNSQTGETRVVDPMQLGSISPFLANQYFAYAAQQKALNKASAGSGGTTDTLTAPTDNSAVSGTSTNQSVLDPSGLSRFATPIKQQPKQAPVKIAPTVGMSQLSGGNQLASQPQQTNAPWLGSQIVNGVNNFFKAPNLQAQSKPPGY